MGVTTHNVATPCEAVCCEKSERNGSHALSPRNQATGGRCEREIGRNQRNSEELG